MNKAAEQGLTLKQEIFCNEYMLDLNGKQAATRAGYSKKSAKAIASQNLAKPIVREKVENLKAIRNKDLQINAQWVLQKAINVIEQAEREGNLSAAIMGLRLVSLYTGGFETGDKLKISQRAIEHADISEESKKEMQGGVLANVIQGQKQESEEQAKEMKRFLEQGKLLGRNLLLAEQKAAEVEHSPEVRQLLEDVILHKSDSREAKEERERERKRFLKVGRAEGRREVLAEMQEQQQDGKKSKALKTLLDRFMLNQNDGKNAESSRKD